MAFFKKRVRLNGKDFTSKEEAHKAMKKAFKGSEYYGSNLDALHDVLTSIMKDTVIVYVNQENAKEYLGEYADLIIKVLEDSAKENKHLILKI